MKRILSLVSVAALSLTAAAAVIGLDRRGPFSVKADGAPFRMSPAEISRLRNLVGFVYCPGARDLRNSYGASGFLIGTATDMYVVTAAHSFLDEAGNPRDPLSSCSFTSFGLHSERIPLLFNRRRDPSDTFLTYDWAKDPANDLVIVRLSRPSPEAEPFRLSQGVGSLEGLDDTRMFAISAIQEGFDVGSDLILQNCAARKFYPSNPKRPSVAYTDCAAKVGASGSLVLTRVNGVLVPTGMIQASATGPDGLPYDEASKNYTFTLGLDGRVLEQARALMGASF